jgi:hypothetical protein
MGSKTSATRRKLFAPMRGRPRTNSSKSTLPRFAFGEMIAEQRETLGLAKPPGSNQHRVKIGPDASLSDAGIDKHLADRARKYAAVPEETFEAILAERRERIEQENARVTVNLTTEAMRYTKEGIAGAPGRSGTRGIWPGSQASPRSDDPSAYAKLRPLLARRGRRSYEPQSGRCS